MQIKIDKWYLDQVDALGGVSIFYVACLKLGILPTFRWAARFFNQANGVTNETQWWRHIEMPYRRELAWKWSMPKGPVHSWHPVHQSKTLSLLDQDGSHIHWTCHSPLATCCNSTDHQEGIKGYLEHISIHLQTARLPFKKLWWGRAHVENQSLVWIRWSEGVERTWILSNGVPVKGELQTEFDGTVVVQIGASLWRVQQERVLRSRDLKKHLPRWLVALTGSLPIAREHKFFGSVSLEVDQGALKHGSAIAEIVQWS